MGIGRVSTQFFVANTPAGEPFVLDDGCELPRLEVAYETYGTLNSARDNAILLFHAISGSQHAAGYNPSVNSVGKLWTEECKSGWWDSFIGPAKALDTERYFVICANYIGSCYGSTGPLSVDPKTAQPYMGNFPWPSIWDVLRTQVALLDHMGISALHATIGASLGGKMALGLATRYPERVKTVIALACGMDVTILQRILNYEQILAIESDRNFNGGHYQGNAKPDDGLSLARIIAHKTYVSLEVLADRARDELRGNGGGNGHYAMTHPVESYMLHHGKKFVERFDANSYLRMLSLWQRYDLFDGLEEGKKLDLFSRCRGQRFLIFSIDSDVCFYPEEQALIVSALEGQGIPVKHITVHSTKGHDAFLLEPDLFAPYISYVLKGG